MTVEFREIELAASQLHGLISGVPNQLDRLYQELSLCDQEISDLKHLIEFENFNASDGYRHARDLQITLRQRRKFKQEIDHLRSFQDTVKAQRPLAHQTKSIGDLVIARKKLLFNKSYTPKVRSDLSERFEKCNKNKKLN